MFSRFIKKIQKILKFIFNNCFEILFKKKNNFLKYISKEPLIISFSIVLKGYSKSHQKETPPPL